MNNQSSLFSRVAFFVFLMSCSNVYNENGLKQADGYDKIEVSNSADEYKSAILSGPTEFKIKSYESERAWERAVFFFKNYIDSKLEYSYIGKNKKIVATSKNYTYEISVSPENNFYKYKVQCFAGNSQNQSDESIVNAKNLSYFIRSGEIELNLLKL